MTGTNGFARSQLGDAILFDDCERGPSFASTTMIVFDVPSVMSLIRDDWRGLNAQPFPVNTR